MFPLTESRIYRRFGRLRRCEAIAERGLWSLLKNDGRALGVLFGGDVADVRDEVEEMAGFIAFWRSGSAGPEDVGRPCGCTAS